MLRALAVGWTVLIFIACSLPGQNLPQDPALTFDKVAHFVLFAGLGLFWMAATSSPLSKRTPRVLLGGGGYAVALELYQGLLPVLHRSGDPFDVLANGLGLLAGVGGYHWWLRRKKANGLFE